MPIDFTGTWKMRNGQVVVITGRGSGIDAKGEIFEHLWFGHIDNVMHHWTADGKHIALLEFDLMVRGTPNPYMKDDLIF